MPSRLTNIGYLAELTKFGVLRPNDAFKCLKAMLDDFSPPNAQAGGGPASHCSPNPLIPRIRTPT
eukprot:5713979-Prymnesium_polylepis.1